MKIIQKLCLVALALLAAVIVTMRPAAAQQQRPNMIVIMGDDIGWFNVGAYNQGMMSGRTPNLDRLAAEGMRFTDYYAEASCTAGRANFITGELPIRTGMTTVGQAGAPIGLPDEAPTIATALKSMGYATGQFGKNHLGDLNRFLPTVHGFDEFFGYLYHLDAMEDPCHPNYPQALKNTVGPRNMVHSYATTVDDQTVQPRWGKIGKQRIEDAGELCPKRMETVDDEILAETMKFIDKSRAENKPFFIWLNPTRMHVVTHLSEKYEKMRNSENGWTIEEAGMAQLDDVVGAVMQKLKDTGIENDTVIAFTTDNGAENFTWPDGGQTPFAGGKGTVLEGGFRVPMIAALAGQGAGRQGREPDRVRARLVPDAGVARRQPQHRRRAQEGQTDRRSHLQGLSRRLRPDRSLHRQGQDEAERDFLLRGIDARRGADQRLQVPLHRSAPGLARRHRQDGLADPHQPAPRPARAHRHRRIAEFRQLVHLRVLALRLRQGRGAESTPRPSSTIRRCSGARASISKP